MHPQISITSIYEWRGGRLLGASDEEIISAATEDSRTLVTYDQKTIVPILVRLGATSTEHAGVVFIDHRTIASNNFGALTRALIALWESAFSESGIDRVQFLTASE